MRGPSVIMNKDAKVAKATVIMDEDQVAQILTDRDLAPDYRKVYAVIWPRKDWADEFAAENRMHGHEVEVYDHPQGALEIVRVNVAPPEPSAERA